jgi:hypothetical protein
MLAAIEEVRDAADRRFGLWEDGTMSDDADTETRQLVAALR